MKDEVRASTGFPSSFRLHPSVLPSPTPHARLTRVERPRVDFSSSADAYSVADNPDSPEPRGARARARAFARGGARDRVAAARRLGLARRAGGDARVARPR